MWTPLWSQLVISAHPQLKKKKNHHLGIYPLRLFSILHNSHSILSLLPLHLSLSGLRLHCRSFSSSSSAFISSSLHLTSSRLINCQPTTPLFHSSPTTWISLPHSFYFLLFAYYFLNVFYFSVLYLIFIFYFLFLTCSLIDWIIE